MTIAFFLGRDVILDHCYALPLLWKERPKIRIEVIQDWLREGKIFWLVDLGTFQVIKRKTRRESSDWRRDPDTG